MFEFQHYNLKQTFQLVGPVLFPKQWDGVFEIPAEPTSSCFHSLPTEDAKVWSARMLNERTLPAVLKNLHKSAATLTDGRELSIAKEIAAEWAQGQPADVWDAVYRRMSVTHVSFLEAQIAIWHAAARRKRVIGWIEDRAWSGSEAGPVLQAFALDQTSGLRVRIPARLWNVTAFKVDWAQSLATLEDTSVPTEEQFGTHIGDWPAEGTVGFRRADVDACLADSVVLEGQSEPDDRASVSQGSPGSSRSGPDPTKRLVGRPNARAAILETAYWLERKNLLNCNTQKANYRRIRRIARHLLRQRTDQNLSDDTIKLHWNDLLPDYTPRTDGAFIAPDGSPGAPPDEWHQ